MAAKRWSNVVFAALFIVAIVLFGRIVWPFLMPVLLGGFLCVLFMPVHRFFLRRVRPQVAAGFSTAFVVLALIVPVCVMAALVIRELLAIGDQARAMLENTDLRHELYQRLPLALQRYVHLKAEPASLDEALASTISSGVNVLTRALPKAAEIGIGIFLSVIAMYYFFLDGERLVREGARLLPLDARYFEAFSKEFKDVTYAIMWGNTLTAIIQGVTCFVGLLIAGIPHPAVWAVATCLVAMIPIGGTAFIWAPAGLILIACGKPVHGGFLLAWGALVVSALDNLIRPRLCGTRIAIHPLLVFISMFGGLYVFGFMGLLVGPLIAAIFMAMVRIWRRDFLAPVTAALASQPPAPVVAPPPAEPALTPVVH